MTLHAKAASQYIQLKREISALDTLSRPNVLGKSIVDKKKHLGKVILGNFPS